MRVAAVVLAAGASTRMGTSKLLLALGGEPLIRRSVRAATDAGMDLTLVVTAPGDRAIRAAVNDLGVEFVTNDDPTTPPGRSFQLALGQLDDTVDAAILCLGDMVDVSPSMLAGLRATAIDTNAAVVMSHFGDVPAPPHLIHRSVFEEALQAPSNYLVRYLVKRFPDRVAVAAWPADAVTDIDTPEDLDEVRNRPG